MLSKNWMFCLSSVVVAIWSLVCPVKSKIAHFKGLGHAIEEHCTPLDLVDREAMESAL